jgi:hypothetical protein
VGAKTRFFAALKMTVEAARITEQDYLRPVAPVMLANCAKMSSSWTVK